MSANTFDAHENMHDTLERRTWSSKNEVYFLLMIYETLLGKDLTRFLCHDNVEKALRPAGPSLLPDGWGGFLT